MLSTLPDPGARDGVLDDEDVDISIGLRLTILRSSPSGSTSVDGVLSPLDEDGEVDEDEDDGGLEYWLIPTNPTINIVKAIAVLKRLLNRSWKITIPQTILIMTFMDAHVPTAIAKPAFRIP
mmetsp:Transcript_22330/g.38004  ORF Transcript_22330/g.38004 Transcript_22330/m.38004 type:complete len:122 (+) Transcript_22330:929-1294(+)